MRQLRLLARQFMLKTKENEMIVIDIGWHKIVMDREKALKLVELLESSEVYEDRYLSKEERKKLGVDAEYTYHVYPNEKTFNMRIVADSHYQMAKLAGKPVKS